MDVRMPWLCNISGPMVRQYDSCHNKLPLSNKESFLIFYFSCSELPNPAVSWCKVEAFINKPEYVCVTPNPAAVPPLVIMTFNLRTLPNPKTHQNEVWCIHFLFYYRPRSWEINAFGTVCLSIRPSVCLNVCLAQEILIWILHYACGVEWSIYGFGLPSA